jgi:hypothetical protein
MAFARFHYYIAAAPAIAARGPATRHKLLPPECHAPIPAATGLYPNYRFIDEHLFCRCASNRFQILLVAHQG